MKNIVIIGAGDLGKEVVWLIEDINKKEPTYLILGFLDDDPAKEGKEFYGYRILGGTEQLTELGSILPLSAVIAIQDGAIRKKIVEAHPEFNNWESIIHPTAVIASSSRIGKGSIFFPHTTVSVDTNAGNSCLYYINTTICNDCTIGDYVSFMAGTCISEHAIVGNESFFKSNSCLPPHATIDDRTVFSSN